MKEYMTDLGVVLMLISLAGMLIPEGSIKKYASLAMGFMLIVATLSILPDGKGKINLTAENFSISEEEIASSQANFRAEVIKKHRENLKGKIEEHMLHGSKAFVEVSPDGEVISVTLLLRGDESRAILYIVENLGIGREKIKLEYDEN